jgi:membrane protein YdbS with pleckstrin-like domain
MSLPRKLMIDGEQTVETTRTHVKRLFLPFGVLLVACVAAGFLIAEIGDKGDGKAGWVVVAIAAVLIVWGSLIPFLSWYLWTYTLTNKRIVEQKGILTRTGRIIPLSRVNDVAFEKNLNDRILGCGTLIIHDASEQAGLQLHDIPRVEAFHRTVTNLVFERHDAQRNDESV